MLVYIKLSPYLLYRTEQVMTAQVYFISGIDTGIGKTYATGYLAKLWNQQGTKPLPKN